MILLVHQAFVTNDIGVCEYSLGRLIARVLRAAVPLKSRRELAYPQGVEIE